MTTVPNSCPDFHEIWKPQPPEALRACTGMVYMLYLLVGIIIPVYSR